jgi:virulence-associated protein VapD
LFELEDKTKDSKEIYFELYSEAYSKLAHALNKFIEENKQGDEVLKNITVIEEPLTYQKLLDENPHLGTIEEKVKQFYHLNQDKLEEDKSQES